ncbi:MAG: hypothetical protein D6797_00900 [Bdellovibrio sp.]|nr:MAG: hypothetical protein D6797_00900 [Bdellovibrio sp.]
MGLVVHAYSTFEWSRKMMDPQFLSWLNGSSAAPVLSGGGETGGAKILPFPSAGVKADREESKVKTINELERIAIENAIYEYKGNLTEAAKALGIGRATLYRKVKLYNIDPADARNKRREKKVA